MRGSRSLLTVGLEGRVAPGLSGPGSSNQVHAPPRGDRESAGAPPLSAGKGWASARHEGTLGGHLASLRPSMNAAPLLAMLLAGPGGGDVFDACKPYVQGPLELDPHAGSATWTFGNLGLLFGAVTLTPGAASPSCRAAGSACTPTRACPPGGPPT